MTRIQTVTAYKTNDGVFHKTELDAKLHVAGINAKIAHAKSEIKRHAEIQRGQRATLRDHVRFDNANAAIGRNRTFEINYTPYVQTAIAHTTNTIHIMEKQLKAMLKKLRG
jgi:hypothetical protein